MASNKQYVFHADGQDYAVVMECCVCGRAGTTCSLTLFSPDQVKNMSMFVNCQLVELREANQYCFVCDCCKGMLSQCSRNIELMCVTPLFIPERIDYRCTFCKTPRSYKILSLPKDGVPYSVCNRLLAGAPPEIIWICRACDEVLSDVVEIRELYLSTVSKRRLEDNPQTKNCPVTQELPVPAKISVTNRMEHETSNVSVTCGVGQVEQTGIETLEVNVEVKLPDTHKNDSVRPLVIIDKVSIYGMDIVDPKLDDSLNKLLIDQSESTVYGNLFSPKATFDNSAAYFPRAFLINDLELGNKEDSALNKPEDLLIDLDLESKNLNMKDDNLICGADIVDPKLDNDSLVLNKSNKSLTDKSENTVYGADLFSPKATLNKTMPYIPRAFLLADLELDDKEDSVLNKPGDLLIDLESKNLIMKDDNLICGVDIVDPKLDNDNLVLSKSDKSLIDQSENMVYEADLFSPKAILNKTMSYIPRAFRLTDLELDNKEVSVLNKPERLLIDLNMESKNLIMNDDPKLDNDSLALNKPDKSLTDQFENKVYGTDLFSPEATFKKTTSYIPRAFLISDLELDNKEDSVLNKPGDLLIDLDMESKNLIMKDDDLICGVDIVDSKLDNDSSVLSKPDKSLTDESENTVYGAYLLSPKETSKKMTSYIPRAFLVTDLELEYKDDSVLHKPEDLLIDLEMESKNLIMKDDNLICGVVFVDPQLDNDSLVLNKPDKSGDLELGNKGDSILNKPRDSLIDVDMESKNPIMEDDNLICGVDILDLKLDNDSLVLNKPDKSGDDLFSTKVAFSKTASYIPKSFPITALELDNNEDSLLNKFEKFGLNTPNKSKIIDFSNKGGDVHTSSPKIDNITVYMTRPMNADFEFDKNNTPESNKSEELSFDQLEFDVATENTKTEVETTVYSLDTFSPVKTVDYIDYLLSVTPGPLPRDKVYIADRSSSSRNFEDSMYYSSEDPWTDNLMTDESTFNSEDKKYISGYEKAEIIDNFQKSLMDELVVCSKDFASGDSSFDDSIDFEIDFITHYMSTLSLGNEDSDCEEIENTEDTEHTEQKVHDETPEDILIEVSEVFTSNSKLTEDRAI